MAEQLLTRTRRQSLSRFVRLAVHIDMIHTAPAATENGAHSGIPAKLVSFRECKGEEYAKKDVQVLTTAISYPSMPVHWDVLTFEKSKGVLTTGEAREQNHSRIVVFSTVIPNENLLLRSRTIASWIFEMIFLEF